MRGGPCRRGETCSLLEQSSSYSSPLKGSERGFRKIKTVSFVVGFSPVCVFFSAYQIGSGFQVLRTQDFDLLL